MVKKDMPLGIISASFTFDRITKDLEPVVLEYNKICGWLQFIQKEGMSPFWWGVSTKKGLKCNCKPIRSKEEFEESKKKLQAYIDKVNEKYALKIRRKRIEIQIRSKYVGLRYGINCFHAFSVDLLENCKNQFR